MPPSPRPRRSELATPASNDDMFAKAAASGADLVFLDLEDACAPAEVCTLGSLRPASISSHRSGFQLSRRKLAAAARAYTRQSSGSLRSRTFSHEETRRPPVVLVINCSAVNPSK